MITLTRSRALKEWDKFWDQTKKEWFKVEMLQDYSSEDVGPSLNAWLSGHKKKSIQLMLVDKNEREWAEQTKKASFKKIRIHIVQKPYTPYLEWEIEHYKNLNIPLGGEEVYLIDRKDVKDLNLPDGDFVIFDKISVVRNYYNSKGKVYKMDFYEKKRNDDIDEFLTIREKLLIRMSQSRPLV